LPLADRVTNPVTRGRDHVAVRSRLIDRAVGLKSDIRMLAIAAGDFCRASLLCSL